MNKKGFTLIELLAVIVILAVIALITVPAVMNVVSEAKQSAFKDSAYGIIKTAEGTYVQDTFQNNIKDKFFLFVDGVMTSYPSGSELNYKGSTPLDGGLVLHSDGTVTMAIHDGTYCAVKTKEAIEVTLSVKTKAECNNEILYRQASAPFTNLISNGDFSSGTTGWVTTLSYSTQTIIGDRLRSTKNAVLVYFGTQLLTRPIAIGHVLYSSTEISGNKNNTVTVEYQTNYAGDGNGGAIPISVSTTMNRISFNRTLTGVTNYINFSAWNYNLVGDYIEIKNPIVIDLSNVFGIGNEPTKAQMDLNINKIWIDTANGNTPKRFTAGGWISL